MSDDDNGAEARRLRLELKKKTAASSVVFEDPDKAIEGVLADDESNKRTGPKSKRKHQLGVKRERGAVNRDSDLVLDGLDEPMDTRRGRAATRIQSVYRGHLQRNVYFCLLGEEVVAIEDRSRAAILIQCAFRSFQARNMYFEKLAADSEHTTRIPSAVSFESESVPQKIFLQYIQILEGHAQAVQQALLAAQGEAVSSERDLGRDADAKLQSLVEENRELQSKLTEATAFMKEMSQGGVSSLEVQNLKIQLEMKDEEIEELQEDLAHRKKQIDELKLAGEDADAGQRDHTTDEQDIDRQIKAQINAAQVQGEGIELTLGVLIESVSAALKSHHQANMAVGSLQTTAESLRKTHNAVKLHNQQLQGEMKELKNEHQQITDGLVAQVEQLSAELAQNNALVEAEKASFGKLAQEFHQNAGEKLAQTQAEVMELRSTMTSLKRQKTEVEAKLEDAHETLKARDLDIARLQQETAAANLAMREMHGNREELQARSREVMSHQADLARQTAEISALKEAVQCLELTQADSKAEINALTEVHEKTQETIRVLEAEGEGLRMELDQARENALLKEKALQEIQISSKAAIAEAHQERAAAVEGMSQISRIAVKHISPAELDDVVKKYEKYDGGIDPQHMKQLVEGLVNIVERELEKERREHEDSKAALALSLESKNSEISDLTRELDALKDHSAALLQEKTSDTGLLHSATQERIRMQDQLNASHRTLETMRNELARLAGSDDDLQELRQTLHQVQLEIEQGLTEKEQVDKERNELRDKMISANQRIERLEWQLKEAGHVHCTDTAKPEGEILEQEQIESSKKLEQVLVEHSAALKTIEMNYQTIMSLGLEVETLRTQLLNAVSENVSLSTVSDVQSKLDNQLQQLSPRQVRKKDVASELEVEYSLLIEALSRTGMGVDVAIFQAIHLCEALVQKVAFLQRKQIEIERERILDREKAEEREEERARAAALAEERRVIQEIARQEQKAKKAAEEREKQREQERESASKQKGDDVVHETREMRLLLEQKEMLLVSQGATVTALETAIEALKGQVHSVASEMSTALHEKDNMITQLQRELAEWPSKHTTGIRTTNLSMSAGLETQKTRDEQREALGMVGPGFTTGSGTSGEKSGELLSEAVADPPFPPSAPVWGAGVSGRITPSLSQRLRSLTVSAAEFSASVRATAPADNSPRGNASIPSTLVVLFARSSKLFLPSAKHSLTFFEQEYDRTDRRRKKLLFQTRLICSSLLETMIQSSAKSRRFSTANGFKKRASGRATWRKGAGMCSQNLSRKE